jgi:hypothetical protein
MSRQVVHIQCDSEKKVHNLREDTIDNWEKKVHMSMCLILNVYRGRAVWIYRPNSVRFLFVWLKSEVYERKVDTPDELLDRILDAAACIKNIMFNSTENHAIYTHELQSALKFTVGFGNIYCEL